MTACIETRGLGKTYGATRALVDLNLKVQSGQVFGFLGPNGAGKTTTIRILLSVQRPTSGQATVFGLDAQAESVEIHRRVGYMPGDLELYPRLNGKQLIDWFAHARDLHNPPLARVLIERFGVVIDRPIRELSKGNRQKIGLVVAFMHRPDLLILDEPTSGLDPLMQNEFEKLVRETISEGRTVFLSSHELDEVQKLADHVAIIRAGRLVTTDTVDALRRNAPTKIEACFPVDIDAKLFAALDGVSVLTHDGGRISLEVNGRLGPVLRAIADRDPIDVISRHADLDELFLQYYRDTPQKDASDAH